METSNAHDPGVDPIVAAYIAISLVAIVLPWLGLRRTGRDCFRAVGLINAVFCGWNLCFAVLSAFVPVWPTYFMLLNPVMGIVTISMWFLVRRAPAGR